MYISPKSETSVISGLILMPLGVEQTEAYCFEEEN